MPPDDPSDALRSLEFGMRDQLRDLTSEWSMLRQLVRDVKTYNHNRMSNDTCILHGYSMRTYVRNGIERQSGYFPLWYAGPSENAPWIPVEIVLNEYHEVNEHIAALRRALGDMYAYAPGGSQYKRLRDNTLVGR